eukprot:gene14248-biopygen5104
MLSRAFHKGRGVVVHGWVCTHSAPSGWAQQKAWLWRRGRRPAPAACRTPPPRGSRRRTGRDVRAEQEFHGMRLLRRDANRLARALRCGWAQGGLAFQRHNRGGDVRDENVRYGGGRGSRCLPQTPYQEGTAPQQANAFCGAKTFRPDRAGPSFLKDLVLCSVQKKAFVDRVGQQSPDGRPKASQY